MAADLTIPGLNDYVGRFDQATQPSTGDIPDTKWAWWFDTVNLRLLLIRNRGNVLYAVEATQI